MDESLAATAVGVPASTLRQDASAGIVVFLVALPLCLGVALGSGAPMFGGVLAGVIGGIFVGALSGSQVSVSGPTAGQVVIILTAIQNLGSYEALLVAIMLSGLLQIVFGLLNLGVIADYVPNAVIKGMLAGIGILIVLKQIPHALGWDRDYEGDFHFWEFNGNTIFSDIVKAIASASPGALIIFLAGLAALLLWPSLAKYSRLFQLAPGPLAVVALGIAVNQLFGAMWPSLQLIDTSHLVNLPIPRNAADFLHQFAFPDFSAITNKAMWSVAVTIAIAGSLETLLSLEAADRLDPYKRISSPSRELLVQGGGNVISGLLGGLPITSVVVRTAANVEAGARSRMSTIIHGLLLLLAVILLPGVLKLTPLASLATILIVVGFKLTKPAVYRAVYSQGWSQFIPFLVTTVAVVFLDLLTGVLVGCACGIFFVIKTNHHDAITVVSQGADYLFRFTKDASFINKNELRRKLRELPDGSRVLIDGARALFVDHDIIEIVDEFRQLAPYKNIRIGVKQFGS